VGGSGSAPLSRADGAELARATAKARVLARLLAGDERVIADELVVMLEAMAGPVAAVVSLAARRPKR